MKNKQILTKLLKLKKFKKLFELRHTKIVQDLRVQAHGWFLILNKKRVIIAATYFRKTF